MRKRRKEEEKEVEENGGKEYETTCEGGDADEADSGRGAEW